MLNDFIDMSVDEERGKKKDLEAARRNRMEVDGEVE